MGLNYRSAALAVAILSALAAPAQAGRPGSWTKVHEADANTTEVGVARSAGGALNVLWSRDADNAVLNTQLSANARTLNGPHAVFGYAGAVNSSVSLLPAPGGGLRAFFSGLSDDHALDGVMATATSPDGVSWSVQSTPASDGRAANRSPVYAAAGIGGTIGTDRTPISIWGDSSPGAAGYHVGTSSTEPDVHFGGSNASVSHPNAAADSETGQVVIAWSDLDAGQTLVQSIFPAGPRAVAPGGGAPDPLERVGMTGRDGGGIFVAYLRGSNQFLGRVTVWRVGAPDRVRGLPGARGARFPGVTRGPAGRVWAFWADTVRNATRVFAARSNEAATRFGARVPVKLPGGAASTLFSLEGEGTAPGGMLDLVALVEQTDGIANWHQRVEPGITLRAKALGGGEVRFKTRDAGKKLETTIRFAGETKATGDDGKVVMSAEPRRKKYKAKATRDGYHRASRRVKVK